MSEIKKIGRYEIRKEIGRGGMATVYLAHDPRFKRDVALKVLPRQYTHDPMFRARFEREAQTIAALEHPAIVPVYDYGEEDSQPYLVMRYMPGGSLSERLDNGPLPLMQVVKILDRVAAALDRAHSMGIIHRDLKPGNILFDQYDDAFLADFGIAKMAEATAALTGSAIVGTPAYMSPEQVKGQKIDGRSDIYTLGVILFELLTGKRPFESDTPMGLAFKHVHEPAPHLIDTKEELPPGLDLTVNQAMAKDADKRFSTAGDLIASVRANLQQTTPSQPDESVTKPNIPTGFLDSSEVVQPTEVISEEDILEPESVQTDLGLKATQVSGSDQSIQSPSATTPASKQSRTMILGFGVLFIVAAIVAGIFIFRPSPFGGAVAGVATPVTQVAVSPSATAVTQTTPPEITVTTVPPTVTDEPVPTDIPPMPTSRPTDTLPPTPDLITILLPDSVIIAGTFQPQLGCGEWTPSCAESALVYKDANDLWLATFELKAGSYEYKAALNGSWDDNFGLNAEYYGANVPLEVVEDTAVTFWYDHKTHWVSDSINSIVANVPGSFQDEIGCSEDWQPDCLRSLLEDPDGDGIYTFITALIPTGDYEAKVAINQSWEENYGAQREQDGPNIPFTVGEGQAVIFTYDPNSHLLTIKTSDDIPEGLFTLSD